MSFGIDDGPNIVIDCVLCIAFKDDINLFTVNGLFIHTKPQEYKDQIPVAVVDALEQLGVDRVKLTGTNYRPINNICFKSLYSFKPNCYDN